MLKYIAKLNWIIVLLLAGMAVVACEKDETEALADDPLGLGLDDYITIRDNEAADGNWQLCFELVYPVAIEYPNGTTEVVNDVDGLDGLYFAWRKGNPNPKNQPTIAMPFTVLMGGEEEAIIDSKETLRALLDECLPFRDGTGNQHQHQHQHNFNGKGPNGTSPNGDYDCENGPRARDSKQNQNGGNGNGGN